MVSPCAEGHRGIYALSCLERVDRAQPGTGVEGTPINHDRARFFRKLGPLIRHALRRATFPVGEGFLRRGYSLPSP